MKFGLGTFTFQAPPWYDGSVHDVYREGIELVELAESVGFDSAWTSEHHFADDGFLPSPVTALAAFAGVTESIELGTSIALAPFYDPLRLAEDLAVTDQISDGRVSVGVGLGYRKREFEGYRIDRSTRVGRMIELVEVLKRAWAGDRFTFDGDHYTYGPAEVTPTPAAEPRPRIYIGANVETAIRRAARHADGYIPSRVSGFDDVPAQYRIFKEGKAEAEPPVGGYELPVMAYGMVAEDRETAWERMRDGYAYFHHRHTDYRTTSPDEWFKADDPGSFADTLDSDREAALRDRAVFGTPEDVIDWIEGLHDRLGDDLHLIYRVRHPGVPFDHAAEAVELFAEGVIPHFTD